MTKKEFIEFYDLFTKVVKQEVNGEYCLNASAGLVDYCGGYTLVLRPECILWGSELAMIQALCDRFAHSLEISMQRGSLTIW